MTKDNRSEAGRKNSRIGRRRLLGALIGAASVYFLKDRSALAQSANAQGTDLNQRYDELFQNLLSDAELLQAARAERDRHTYFAMFGMDTLAASVDRRTPPSSTPISQRAIDLIIACEISSELLYTRNYQRPTWPFGLSGVTIGIGYDVGYVTKDMLKEDWQDFVAAEIIERLGDACGRKGDSANEIVGSFRDIAINWESALNQYLRKTQPLYIAETETALKNTELLSPDSLGALVSLVYNRGASFGVSASADSSGRYEEMRNIKKHMSEKEFSKIPDEFRSMKRLWITQANMAGLVKRRELEAALFELGLKST